MKKPLCKKWWIWALAGLFIVISLTACSGGQNESADGDNTIVPDYTIVNSSTYIRDGKECCGYRIVASKELSEEQLRSIFAEVTDDDGYYLHTVWFYEIESDISDIGAYTVGMLDEKAEGKAPEYTATSLSDKDIEAARSAKTKNG